MPGPRFPIASAMGARQSADDFDTIISAMGNSQSIGTGPTLASLTVTVSAATVGSAFSAGVNNTTSGSSLSLTGTGAAGLSISGTTISGTPTTAGTVSIVETLAGATNSPRTTSGLVTVSAAAATLNALTLDSTTATQGAAKTINILGATSGSTITANQLPAGMTLNSGARTISGTPTTAATTAITLTETLAGATNSPRNSNVSVIVAATAAAPTISGTPPSGQVGQAYSFTPTTTGGAAPLVYTFAGRLPPGTSFNTNTGAISGTAGQL